MPTAPEYSSRLPYSPTRTGATSAPSAHSSAMHPSSMQPSAPFSSMGSPSGSSSMDSSWSYPESSNTSWSAESSSGSWSSLVAGLCAGACVGAAVALIFAPMRGSEMRNSVRNYASQGGERLSRLVESGRCLAEDAFNQAAGVIEEGRRAFRTSRDAASSSASSRTYSSPQPLTASVAEIAGVDRRFDEPLGG